MKFAFFVLRRETAAPLPFGISKSSREVILGDCLEDRCDLYAAEPRNKSLWEDYGCVFVCNLAQAMKEKNMTTRKKKCTKKTAVK